MAGVTSRESLKGTNEGNNFVGYNFSHQHTLAYEAKQLIPITQHLDDILINKYLKDIDFNIMCW